MSDARTAAELLEDAARLYRERNAVYGDNFRMVGEVMVKLFPNGVTLTSVNDFNRWHLFELKIVKLTRFAISGLTHIDSIKDDGVYSAMVEAMITEATTPIRGSK